MAGYSIEIFCDDGSNKMVMDTHNKSNEALIRIDDLSLVIGSNSDKKSRSKDTINIVRINGKILTDTMDSIKYLSQWALDNDPNTQKRKMNIDINSKRELDGLDLRRYELSNMYVIDYNEVFDDNDENECKFEMLIKSNLQKPKVTIL